MKTFENWIAVISIFFFGFILGWQLGSIKYDEAKKEIKIYEIKLMVSEKLRDRCYESFRKEYRDGK